jgi:hypothetical protein
MRRGRVPRQLAAIVPAHQPFVQAHRRRDLVRHLVHLTPCVAFAPCAALDQVGNGVQALRSRQIRERFGIPAIGVAHGIVLFVASPMVGSLLLRARAIAKTRGHDALALRRSGVTLLAALLTGTAQ